MAATLFSPLSMGRSVTAVPHDSLKISSLEFSMFDRSPSKKRNRVYVERSTKMRGMIKFYTLDTSVTKKDKKKHDFDTKNDLSWSGLCFDSSEKTILDLNAEKDLEATIIEIQRNQIYAIFSL